MTTMTTGSCTDTRNWISHAFGIHGEWELVRGTVCFHGSFCRSCFFFGGILAGLAQSWSCRLEFYLEDQSEAQQVALHCTTRSVLTMNGEEAFPPTANRDGFMVISRIDWG